MKTMLKKSGTEPNTHIFFIFGISLVVTLQLKLSLSQPSQALQENIAQRSFIHEINLFRKYSNVSEVPNVFVNLQVFQSIDI